MNANSLWCVSQMKKYYFIFLKNYIIKLLKIAKGENMKKSILLLAIPLLALSACNGGGPVVASNMNVKEEITKEAAKPKAEEIANAYKDGTVATPEDKSVKAVSNSTFKEKSNIKVSATIGSGDSALSLSATAVTNASFTENSTFTAFGKGEHVGAYLDNQVTANGTAEANVNLPESLKALLQGGISASAKLNSLTSKNKVQVTNGLYAQSKNNIDASYNTTLQGKTNEGSYKNDNLAIPYYNKDVNFDAKYFPDTIPAVADLNVSQVVSLIVPTEDSAFSTSKFYTSSKGGLIISREFNGKAINDYFAANKDKLVPQLLALLGVDSLPQGASITIDTLSISESSSAKVAVEFDATSKLPVNSYVKANISNFNCTISLNKTSSGSIGDVVKASTTGSPIAIASALFASLSKLSLEFKLEEATLENTTSAQYGGVSYSQLFTAEELTDIQNNSIEIPTEIPTVDVD